MLLYVVAHEVRCLQFISQIDEVKLSMPSLKVLHIHGVL